MEEISKMTTINPIEETPLIFDEERPQTALLVLS